MDKLDLKGLSRFAAIIHIPEGAFCSALAEKGKQYAVYLFHGSHDSAWGANFIPNPGSYSDSLTLEAVPAGMYSLQWFDPSSGNVKGAENLTWKGGDFTVRTPPYSLDIAMKIINLP